MITPGFPAPVLDGANVLAALAPRPPLDWRRLTDRESAILAGMKSNAPPWFEVWERPRSALRVIRSLDVYPGETLRWHLSVSTPVRLPSWEEMGRARDALMPADVFLCIQHPPREFWMNFHPNVLHMMELRDPGLIAQAVSEGMNARRRGFGSPSPGRTVR